MQWLECLVDITKFCGCFADGLHARHSVGPSAVHAATWMQESQMLWKYVELLYLYARNSHITIVSRTFVFIRKSLTYNGNSSNLCIWICVAITDTETDKWRAGCWKLRPFLHRALLTKKKWMIPEECCQQRYQPAMPSNVESPVAKQAGPRLCLSASQLETLGNDRRCVSRLSLEPNTARNTFSCNARS